MKLLLTRPRAQSERFARETLAALGREVPVVIAPLIEILPRGLTIDPGGAAGLIFTSENGVAAFAGIDARRHWPVWCVGERTAQAARAAGFARVELGGGDAEALLAGILAARRRGPLLHLRGQHAAGDLVGRLTAAGLPATAAVVYDQRACALPAEARALLADPAEDLLLPLFSPRSAALLVKAAAAAVTEARLHPVAISMATAEVWDAGGAGLGQPARIAAAPDAPAMIAALAEVLAEGSAGADD
jgi:uroporphyrinogen-III synthase